METIGESGFGTTALSNIQIPTGLSELSFGIFAGTPITKIEIPSNIKTIDERAFEGCIYLSEVMILDGVESIGDEVFGKVDSLTQVLIPESVTDINEYAFSGNTDQLVIKAPTGSYAEQYAAEQEIAFQAQ